MKKRVLSLALALVMALALVPTAAFAADITVTEAIPFRFDRAGDFSEGFAWVELDGKYGFIDKTGKEVVPCTLEYDEVGSFDQGLAPTRCGAQHGFIDTTGKEILPCNYYGSNAVIYNTPVFTDGVAVVSVIEYVDGGELHHYGVIDTTGKEVVPMGKYKIGDFSEGLAAVKDENGKWGFIDKTGKLVVPYKYTNYWEFYPVFHEGFARVELDGKWGYLGINQPTSAPLTAAPTNDALTVDGVSQVPTAYKIGGANYFKIRDLGENLGFNVGWTLEQGMFIESDKPYTGAD